MGSRFSNARNPRHATPGFTLIEMLVVLAIIGLIAGIAFPAVERSVDTMRFRGAAATLTLTLQSAHAHAIRRGEPVRVALNPDTRSYAATALPPEPLGEGIALALPAEGIRFFQDGTSSGGQATLSAGPHTLRLAVDPNTGAIGAGK